MQSKLPDVNQAIVKHRGDAISAYSQKNYNMVIISLDSIIALLPDDYKVETNSEKYQELTKEKNLILCEKCEKEIPRDNITTFDQTLPHIEQILAGKPTQLVWICPECQNVLDLEGSKFKVQKFQNPFYLKCIPHPPKRRGLINRCSYDEEFSTWLDIAMSEIESQIGLYRADYAAQQNDDGMKEIEE